MKDDEEKFMKKLIKYYVDRIDNLQEEVIILTRALILATHNCDNYWEEKDALKKKMSLYDYFIEQAKKELKELRGE